MSRSQNQKNYFSFTKGLVTEASAINGVENSSTNEDNMDLVRNGTRIRRRGAEQEIGATSPISGIAATSAPFYTYSAHEWRSVGGDGALNKLIIQEGNNLFIRDLDAPVVSLSTSSLLTDTTAIGGAVGQPQISLPLAAVGGSFPPSERVQVSFGKGVAFIVSASLNPIVLEYHATTNTLSAHYVGGAAGAINVRDFQGADDGLAVDTAPAATSYANLVATNPNHAYNLINQGWTTAHVNTYCTATGTAPSNSDVWWYGKNSTGVFTPAEMDKLWFGSMQAAKGHHIFNAFSKPRSGVAAGATNFSTLARPSVTAFYSGRVWYSGIADGEYSGSVLYSKLIENPLTDSGQCHMDADPTSEIVMDLIASDGGVINIPEAGRIVKLLPVQDGILVFAVNGVWHIKGARDTGFSATGFSVLKVTNIGTESPDSIVEVEGIAMYWNRAGIYTVSLSQSTFTMAGQNITQESIQSKINVISDAALKEVKGVYDPLEREVKFFYSEAINPASPTAVDKILTLDLVLKAWYSGTVSTSPTSPQIVAVFKSLNVSAGATDYETMVRFLYAVPVGTAIELHVGLLHDGGLMDWTIHTGGLPYTSFIETSYEMFGDAMRPKTLDEVHLFFQRTESTVTNGVLDTPSRCLMQYRFDWADDAASGLFTKKEEAYKFPRSFNIPSAVGTFPLNYGQSVISTKHNVRGSGRAMQLRLESVGNNDMHLLGWSVFVSGNSR